MNRLGRTTEERFWSKVQIGGKDECWLWTAFVNDDGYGRFAWVSGCPEGWPQFCQAHRVAWVLSGRPLAPEQRLLHRCDTPRCCNPRHLRPGTQTENVADMMAKGRHARGESRRQRAYQRLSWPKARQIRARFAARATKKGLAREYGVSDTQIRNVITERSWPTAEDPG